MTTRAAARRWLVVAAAVVAGALTFIPGAAAHVVSPGVSNVIDQVTPASGGFTVSVKASAGDELVLTDTGPATVQVLAPTGEPFLRFTRTEVDANTNSITWYAAESLSYNPITSVPGVNPAAGPRWLKVADVGTWTWFDPRLRPDQPADAPASSTPDRPLRLASWTVGLTVDGAAGSVSGHRDYTPVEGSYEQRLDSTTPLPKVTVAVVGGPGASIPAVYLDNSGPTTVTVLGAAGEPMLRISPTAVDANTASPTWLLTAASRDEAPTGLVSARAAPRWQRVANQHSFSWLESRGAAPSAGPPPGHGATGSPATVAHWSFPLTSGSTRVTVRSAVIWEPAHPSVSGGRPVAPIVAGAVGGAALAGVGVWLWRRRVRYDR